MEPQHRDLLPIGRSACVGVCIQWGYPARAMKGAAIKRKPFVQIY